MRKIFLLVLLVAGIYSAKAQNSINQLDANGNRHGVWEKYYNNKRVRYIGTFEHGKEIGTFKYYSAKASDFPIIIKNYTGENALTEISFFKITGILESKGFMNEKSREGKWLFYHSDGKSVMSEENYKNNQLNGVYKTYYLTGKPTEISTYKDGLQEGSYKKYSIKGFLYQDFNYVKGKLNGVATYYSRKTGELKKEGLFKDDQPVGTWKYYSNGELIATDQPALKLKSNRDE